MKRRYISLDSLEIFDAMHMEQPDGSFVVDAEKDGQTTEQHRQGIEYIKKVLQNGAKIMPILVTDQENGTYLRLDGFKRCMAYKELGYKFIEAFICDRVEFATQRDIPFLHKEMKCFKGGQPKEVYPLFEGMEHGEEFDYERVKFLFKGENLRIEVAECIHIHWGSMGQYRLDVGRRDFEELAKGIMQIDG